MCINMYTLFDHNVVILYNHAGIEVVLVADHHQLASTIYVISIIVYQQPTLVTNQGRSKRRNEEIGNKKRK